MNKKNIIKSILLFVIPFIITFSLVSFFKDDSNGFIGGTTDGHGYIRFVSWYSDSSGYHLTFFGLANYTKSFAESKVTDFDEYVGHYIEIGYNSYEDRLNWIHIVGE